MRILLIPYFFKFSLLFYFSLGLSSCHRPIKEPEIQDPIYLDISAEIGKNQADITATITAMDEEHVAINRSKPQTGQYNYHNKKLYVFDNILNKQRQRLLYLQVLLQQRKKEVRLSYMDAFINGEPWPDKKDYEIYMSQKKHTMMPTRIEYLKPKTSKSAATAPKSNVERAPASD